MFKFEKILKIKQNEKDEAFGEYQAAMSQFEREGQKLYELLKRKEDLFALYETQLARGVSVQEIRHHQQFVDGNEKLIAYQQKMVMQARQFMQLKQQKLLEFNIEVNKYEKMKTRYVEQEKIRMNQEENRWLDEISIQQFVHRES